MNVQLKYATLGALLIICQILLSEYVNIWPLLYIAIFPQFIILLPPALNRSAHLLIAFVLGMAIDIFADGVPGLNAAALVAMAYIRPFFLKITLSKANLDTTDNQPLLPRTVEIQKLAMLNGCMLAVFFLVYIMLDSAGSFPFWYTILKIAVCVIVNCIISLVCSKVLFEKFLR